MGAEHPLHMRTTRKVSFFAGQKFRVTPESKRQMKKSKDHAAILVDDKRKHLERRLSASQRDALLLKEAKEDGKERKEFREMLKTANDSFVHALNNMSQSMLSIGNSVARTMDAIGGASSPQAAVPYYNINQVPQRFIQSQEQQGSSNAYKMNSKAQQITRNKLKP